MVIKHFYYLIMNVFIHLVKALMKERELNPNLRQQSNESTTSKRTTTTTVGDAGLDWHRRAYERCKQQAKDEQRPLNEIVSARYGVRNQNTYFLQYDGLIYNLML